MLRVAPDSLSCSEISRKSPDKGDFARFAGFSLITARGRQHLGLAEVFGRPYASFAAISRSAILKPTQLSLARPFKPLLSGPLWVELTRSQLARGTTVL